MTEFMRDRKSLANRAICGAHDDLCSKYTQID